MQLVSATPPALGSARKNQLHASDFVPPPFAIPPPRTLACKAGVPSAPPPILAPLLLILHLPHPPPLFHPPPPHPLPLRPDWADLLREVLDLSETGLTHCTARPLDLAAFRYCPNWPQNPLTRESVMVPNTIRNHAASTVSGVLSTMTPNTARGRTTSRSTRAFTSSLGQMGQCLKDGLYC